MHTPYNDKKSISTCIIYGQSPFPHLYGEILQNYGSKYIAYIGVYWDIGGLFQVTYAASNTCLGITMLSLSELYQNSTLRFLYQ